MPADPSVLAALSAAVSADPDNAALRLHYAELLASADRFANALTEAAQILAKSPADIPALRIAARAADEVGDTRADGYRLLLRALSGPADETPPAGQLPLPQAAPRADAPVVSGGLPSNFGIAGYDPTDAVPMRVGGGADDEIPFEGTERFQSEKPDITLRDVAGMEAVKRRLNVAFLGPMKNPELRAMYGKSLKGGLLLYGPPGCGKTFIARATAGELGARFVSVGLSDVLDMYLGQSERNLHEIFETARRQKPCVLFFDEIDALGRKRSLMRESAGRDVVNQLLAEMDSVGADNEGIFILAATNHPWDVDTALRRPGRLDRTLLVLPPDLPAREAILRRTSEGRPLSKDVDFSWIAQKTDDYSGADMTHLVEGAAENAMEDSITSGKVRPISMNDFKRTMKEIRPSVRPWFDTARNYALFANEGGTYDDLLEYLRSRKLV